eukprot:TRINITY_DN7711_c0_g1_i2.p1 TRINITY_DN7711_c0_g1~~TRINITY_DN7711_c0_g1_i2.p1  ORF type:complete len:238 (-),score=32.85 TRINITY_DN7711_c0_g1_i2:233-946(-)
MGPLIQKKFCGSRGCCYQYCNQGTVPLRCVCPCGQVNGKLAANWSNAKNSKSDNGWNHRMALWKMNAEKVESRGKYLGIVPQDCALFNETVGFNISYGCSDATEEEVERAARLAQIHDLILSLPEGYATPVGERGLKLSGGERQRIGIARCLLRNPSVVLLDEATSALDVRTERHLTDAMDELMRGRTCLVVAHRLATVERCDAVAFIEGGAIVEQGPHKELLRNSERYRQFWEGAR